MKSYTIEEATKEYETFLDDKQTMMISSVNENSEPFASYSPFVQDEQGDFYIFISTAVPHSHNLQTTKKAHILFIEDEINAGHIYARKRLYYKADVEKLSKEDPRDDSIHQLFKDKFGDSVSFFSMMNDFSLFQLKPKEGNIVLGFGAAYKIDDDSKQLRANMIGHDSKK